MRGTNRMQRLAGALAALALCGVAAGCSYEFDEGLPTGPPNVPTREPTTSPAPDPDLPKKEADNYVKLRALLQEPGTPPLLYSEGSLDGPRRGFGKTAVVAVPGSYTVTAACVGAPEAEVFITQEDQLGGAAVTELAVACPLVSTRIVTLQPGLVSANLLLHGPGDTPRTGAVGGVRVSAGG